MSRRQAERASIATGAKPTAIAASPTLTTPLWRRDIAIVAVIALAVAIYRFALLSGQPGPPGSDAGNWLAYTRDLFGHSDKSAASMYFPGTLVILRALLLFFSDLTALKVLAVGSSILAVVPFYYLARRACSQLTSALLSVLLLMAGFLIEMMSWGGYPQLLGTAYLLSAFFFLDRWLLEGVRRDLLLVTGCTFLMVATHHFTLMVFAAGLLLYLPIIRVRERTRLRQFLARTASWGALSALFAFLTLPWYLRYLSLLSGDGSLNATAEQIHSLGDVISYVFLEAPLTWIALCTFVPFLAMLPFGNAGVSRLRPIALSLVVGPMLLYALTKEPRSLQPLEAGALLCLGIVATNALDFLKRAQVRPTMALAGRLTVGLAAVCLILIIVPNSHKRSERALTYYSAMDSGAVEALTWLRENTRPGTVVLPGNRKGVVNYAWWVEGFARRPAYGLIRPSYLAFKQEQEQSAVAQRIIDESTPTDEVERLIQDSGIRYLFIYKPSGGEFQTLVDRIQVYLSFENDEFAILKIADKTASAHD